MLRGLKPRQGQTKMSTAAEKERVEHVCVCTQFLLAATALFCTKLHFQYDYCITAENEKSGRRTFLLLVHMRLLLFLRRKTLNTFSLMFVFLLQ